MNCGDSRPKLGSSFLVMVVRCGKNVQYSKNAHVISQKSKKKNRRLRFIISTDLRPWLLTFLLTSESSIMGTMALTHECLGDIQHQNIKVCQILTVSISHYSPSLYCSLILIKNNEALAVYLTKVRNDLSFVASLAAT